MKNQKTTALPILVTIELLLLCGCVNFMGALITFFYTIWMVKMITIWKKEGKLEFLNGIKE